MPARPPHLSVLGSVNLDLVAHIDRFPRPGETLTGATLEQHAGGKGGNQALAARRLGAEVSLLACVGDDAHANPALEQLQREGVDRSACSSPSALAKASTSLGGTLIPVLPCSTTQFMPEPCTALLTVARANTMASSRTRPKASVRSMEGRHKQ